MFAVSQMEKNVATFGDYSRNSFGVSNLTILRSKVEKILKGSPDLIPSPSLPMKIQIMGGKVCLKG